MRNNLRTEARFFVVTPVAAEFDGGNADVVDLSTRGARLQLTAKKKPGKTAALTVESGTTPISAPATVVWCEIAALALSDEESDRYLCGVKFPEEMRGLDQLIDDLVISKAALPIVDNRSMERYRVIAQLTASFCDVPDLRILDLSIRGARLMTPRLLDRSVFGRLRFAIDENEEHVWVPATVVWARAADRKGRYEAGLKIDGAEDRLRAVINELAKRKGIAIEMDSLRRKYDPFARKRISGLVPLR